MNLQWFIKLWFPVDIKKLNQDHTKSTMQSFKPYIKLPNEKANLSVNAYHTNIVVHM
jgi:hypothetical protein